MSTEDQEDREQYLREQNKLLAEELNTWMDRALVAEGYLEQAIGFIRWAKQFAPNFEVNNNFNQALAVLSGEPEPEPEKPAEIVNSVIIVQ